MHTRDPPVNTVSWKGVHRGLLKRKGNDRVDTTVADVHSSFFVMKRGNRRRSKKCQMLFSDKQEKMDYSISWENLSLHVEKGFECISVKNEQ